MIGLTVLRYRLDTFKTRITFFCEDEIIVHADTFAECCSETWIEEIEDGENLINKKIKEINPVDLPDRSPDQYNEFYSIDFIMHDNSKTRLIFRNESNGYYGGSMFPCVESKEVYDKIKRIKKCKL